MYCHLGHQENTLVKSSTIKRLSFGQEVDFEWRGFLCKYGNIIANKALVGTR